MTERKGQGVFVTCTLADGVLLRGPVMQQSGVDRRVLVGSDTIHLSFPIKHPPLYPLPPNLPAVSRSPSLAAKGLLRGVDHVEEAVLVSLLLIDLRDGCGH